MKNLLKKRPAVDRTPYFKDLVKYLGGLENIKEVSNCTSRIRISVVDFGKVDISKISKQEWNTGAIFNGDELQIVVPKNVSLFTNEFYRYIGEENSIFTGKFVVNQDKNLWDKIVNIIVSVIVPMVPYFLILGLNSTLNSLLTTAWTGDGGRLTDIYFFNQLSIVLGILTRGVNLATPLLICWSIFKLMKQPEILGIMIGLSLVLPSVYTGLDGRGVISQIDLTLLAKQENISGNILEIADQLGYAIHLFGSSIPFPYLFSFDGQVVPMIIVAVIAVWISIGFSKIGKPNSIFQSLLFYFLVLFCSFIIAMIIIAPIAFFITDAISKAFGWLMTANVIRYIAPALVGLTLPVFALFGLDNIYVIMGFIQYYTPDKNDNATSAITTLGFFACYVMAGVMAYLAFVLSQKDKKELRSDIPSVISSGIGGVILPSAGIRINLRHLYPWIATGIGAAVGTTILSITQTTTVLGTGSFLAILSTQNSSTMNGMQTLLNLGMLWMAISIVAAIAVSAIVTILLGKIKYFKERTKRLLEIDYPMVKSSAQN